MLVADAVPTVAGSHMSLFRPSAPRIPRDEASIPGEVGCMMIDIPFRDVTSDIWLRSNASSVAKLTRAVP